MAGFNNDRIIGTALLLPTTAAPTVFGPIGSIYINNSRFMHNMGGTNVFLGTNAGNFTTTGVTSIGIGNNALAALTFGAANTCIGYAAGKLITSGNYNVCIGADQSGTTGAGGNITTGNANTFVGTNAGLVCQTGSLNTGIGASALINCTGSRNVAINSGTSISTGDDNTMIRSQNLITTGSRNILIGIRSGTNYTSTESDNINFNNPGVALENNTMRIGVTGAGNDQVSRAFMAAVAGVAPGGTPQMVIINPATEQLGSQALSPSSLFPWSVITADQTAAVNNGYFCNKAGTLALALPAVSAVGDIIEVININTATGTQFTQAAGQQIFIGNTSSTLGATGTLTSIAIGDSLKIVCTAANTTWRVVSGWGNWTPV